MRIINRIASGTLTFLFAAAVICQWMRQGQQRGGEEVVKAPRGLEHNVLLARHDRLQPDLAAIGAQSRFKSHRRRAPQVLAGLSAVGFLVLGATATAIASNGLPDRPLVPAPEPVSMELFTDSIPITRAYVTFARQHAPNTWRVTVVLHAALSDATADPPQVVIGGAYKLVDCEEPSGTKYCKPPAETMGSAADYGGGVTASTPWLLGDSEAADADPGMWARIVFAVEAPTRAIGFVGDGLTAKASYPVIEGQLPNGEDGEIPLTLTLDALPTPDAWEWRDLQPKHQTSMKTFTWSKPDGIYVIEGKNREAEESDQHSTFIAGVAAGVAGGAFLAALQALSGMWRQ